MEKRSPKQLETEPRTDNTIDGALIVTNNSQTNRSIHAGGSIVSICRKSA